ncbi:Hydrolase-4 domain-containing protein [Mycena indigotica]|uniref:Hydrolase-4 domain-containing protein n=1 Tax=Mycena indigotica TaxID=2126181 RepID=A0A8H6TG02_9AGAR|nr:Hydrolase-4 domain-containing protein [Mycena indigotica]KAF7316057.1 Hydrolase-4 domain-containing protein [Mycena indigotica]
MTVFFTESWRLGPADTNFYVRVYEASDARAILVFVHGAAEHCGRYTDMHTALARDHGILVFAYDLRGYGRTAKDGTHKSPASRRLNSNISFFRSSLWAVHSWVAHLGGTTVLGLMTDPARKENPAVKLVRGVVAGSATLALTKPPPAPVVWLLTQIARVSPWTLFPVRNKTEDLSRNTTTGQEYEDDPLVGVPGSLRCLSSMIKQGELIQRTPDNWPSALPILFVHGDADALASHTATQKFYMNISADDKTWITYAGGTHELHNEPDGIREKSLRDIAVFIQSHC